MPELLGLSNDGPVEINTLRARSPHPYHRRSVQLPLAEVGNVSSSLSPSPLRSGHSTDDEDQSGSAAAFTKRVPIRRTDSDSGTEADDEHFLKGLPAPRPKQHKGFRGERSASETPSPLLSPAILSEVFRHDAGMRRKQHYFSQVSSTREVEDAAIRLAKKGRAELERRAIEVLLLCLVGAIVSSRGDVRAMIATWRIEYGSQSAVMFSLLFAYPFRLMWSAGLSLGLLRTQPRTLPPFFDPAPLLYPPILSTLVAALLAVDNTKVILPNLVLSIASLPASLMCPFGDVRSVYLFQWALSCVPFVVPGLISSLSSARINVQLGSSSTGSHITSEILVLLYPLHHALCVTLGSLTTTSLLTAELQLLSISLINLLCLATSPQAVILKALLWGGGLGLLVFCTRVLSWIVALARVPRWRFKRPKVPGSKMRKPVKYFWRQASWLANLTSFFRHTSDDFGIETDAEDTSLTRMTPLSTDSIKDNEDGARQSINSETRSGTVREQANKRSSGNGTATRDFGSIDSISHHRTLPNIVRRSSKTPERTPSGRKKRTTSSSVQSFFSLTEREALIRTWLYATYVYVCVVCIILVGVREYVGRFALEGWEPVGWALGYLFGNLPHFRLEVVSANLEKWICLPPHLMPDSQSCALGWVEHLRQSTFGPANTRLILCAYWLGIIAVGLAIVFHLSAIYEVDTRRKVFHFMMVAMMLPAVYIDATFAGLALSLVLAVFLLLDLFRASQLPPLSKPLAYFLTPYVDGRDLRGPVVISHIFLLIGCAIPLWLSLGTLGRSGTGTLAGWELPTRDVSMVSGVVCVGLGDAAASLIGRRYGRHKWFWGGGKSIEGSLAFATVVSLALILAKAWLRFGGWVDGGSDGSFAGTVGKAVLAATIASMTEAVLTGGNDNVVVPVVLWLCVKGLSM